MRTKIEQTDYPLAKGESWWIINPNSNVGEFKVPTDASTACMQNLLDFRVGTVYRVHVETDGWVCVTNKDHVVEMPQYIFARYFDAEVFIKGNGTVINPYFFTHTDPSLIRYVDRINPSDYKIEITCADNTTIPCSESK